MQHAMRLRGALLQCGPGLRGAGWPDDARVRLSALAPWLEGEVAASHMTAAWVWGAAEAPPAPLCVAAHAGQHGGFHDGRVRRYELRFSPNDTVRLGNFLVTTPLRTILDMLYEPNRFTENEQHACKRLLDSHEDHTEALQARLAQHKRPHRRLARQRLSEILDRSASDLL